MKLIKQLTLYFQEGTSDKVYEIDLCESGDGFLVNFRYGRRGASLKEGTKTIFPVPLPEAEKVFAALESEKRKKGYVAAGEAPIVMSAEPVSRAGNEKRNKTIVKLLKAAAAGEEPEHWPLSRIIWRAGDLKVREAIPHIIKVADPSDTITIYSVVWAIARCGTSATLGFLQNLQQNKSLPEHVQHVIFEAILKLSDSKEKEALLAGILQSLPRPFRDSIAAGDHKQLRKDLHQFLFELKTTSNEYLIGIYQLSRDNAKLHGVFLEVLNTIRFDYDYFKYIRHIFKVAEMLEDYSTYGVIAKRIERQRPVSRAAFGEKTKNYLVRRVLRQLRKYGEAKEHSYVELATEILLAFRDDQDLTKPRKSTQHFYRYHPETRTHRTEEKNTYYDSYSKHLAFYFILFKNSGRYRQEKDSFVCVPPFMPGDAATADREEAFPHLWNGAAAEIIQLLSFSKVQWVQDFAWKVWKANPGFSEQVETIDVIRFLQAYSSQTQKLGLELARGRYNTSQPDTILLIAMLDSGLDEASVQAEQWISAAQSALLNDTAFVTSLLKMRRMEAHAWLRGFLATHTFGHDQGRIIVGSVIAFLMTAETESDEDRRYINQLGDTLIISFGDFLKDISLDVIKDLFRHPAPDIQAMAGKILMKHEIKAGEIPDDFLKILLTSENVQARAIGVSLLGKFPDDLLLLKKEVLVSLCLSPLPDVRNAVRPVIMKLIRAYPDFGTELVNLFVPAFLIKESYEGLHDDLLSLLSNELQDSLYVIPKEKTLVLLNSRYRTSQLIGNILLKKTIKDEDLSIPELVRLGNNPLADVRKFVWDTFANYPAKVKTASEAAIKITDTDWDDTRIFAFDFFRTVFTSADWNTDLLITLCDSTREDVQDFGREMITKFFEANQGTEYLLKLSQHPSSKVQLFTTNYLQQYASGKMDVLQSLKPYFVTLLSHVNKGRVAKTRIMEFLRNESRKSEDVARLTSEILTRVSVSVAITERAECIVALRDIRAQFPGIQTPLVVKEIGDYVRH